MSFVEASNWIKIHRWIFFVSNLILFSLKLERGRRRLNIEQTKIGLFEMVYPYCCYFFPEHYICFFPVWPPIEVYYLYFVYNDLCVLCRHIYHLWLPLIRWCFSVTNPLHYPLRSRIQLPTACEFEHIFQTQTVDRFLVEENLTEVFSTE